MTPRYESPAQPPVEAVSGWRGRVRGLVEARRAAKISQGRLAAAIGVPRNRLCVWERGRRMPDVVWYEVWRVELKRLVREGKVGESGE